MDSRVSKDKHLMYLMYIVKKNIPGRRKGRTYPYYYLVKSVRESGKVVQKHVAYLGKEKSISLEKLQQKGVDLGEAREVEDLTVLNRSSG